jgi:CheY-like chemotaxis protein
LVSGMFHGSHHRLSFGSNGREAVEKAVALRPDVILLDIRMPGMDGREALAEIRKIPGHELTPVIAVTASSLMSEETELKTRFSGYVRKPFSKRELFDELAQFLPRRGNTDPAASASSPASDAAALNIPPELSRELRRLLDEEWPALRDSLAINETRAFAARLRNLCERWPCGPLDTYAQGLARHAENYAVVELEKHLFEFPTLVERLEHTPRS